MRFRALTSVTVAGTAALVAVLTAQPAAAAPAGAITCRAANSCTTTYHHGGGSLYVDIDAISLGSDTATAEVQWEIMYDGDTPCADYVGVNEPARTFPCGNQPAGDYLVMGRLVGSLGRVDWRLGAHH